MLTRGWPCWLEFCYLLAWLNVFLTVVTMTDSSNSDSKHLSSGPTSPVGVGRRRLLRAGLAATPVVLAVSGRSAMAGNACKGLSPLAWASVAPNGTCVVDGTSHTIQSHALGNSPGGWAPNCGGSAKTFQWDWPTVHCQPCVRVKNTSGQYIYWTSGWNAFSSIPSTAYGWGGGTKYSAKFGGSETRSFSRSAQLRHVTQSAFSRRIQSLEAWAGVALIDRSSYPTRLTPAGDTLYAQALELLQSLHNTRDMLRLQGLAEQDLKALLEPSLQNFDRQFK